MKMIFLWAIFGVVMISCNSSQKNNAPIKNSEIKQKAKPRLLIYLELMRELFLQQIVKA